MKPLSVLLGCLLLKTCCGMGDGEYCFSCDAGSKESHGSRCSDKYTPPHNIKISPNICDDISKNLTEEHRLCKQYPKGYIFECYTDYDGNFFNCKSSCTVPLEDVGKSIGIQDNLSKVMNHGLLTGFGDDGDHHPDLLSGLDLNMFNTDPSQNLHAPALADRRKSHSGSQASNPRSRSSIPTSRAVKHQTNPGYQPVPPPGAPPEAFNVNKPLMFQDDYPQYNFQAYREAPQPFFYPGQNQRAGSYDDSKQYGRNGGVVNPSASLNQGYQGQNLQRTQAQRNQYPGKQNHQRLQDHQKQYPTEQNYQGHPPFQTQYQRDQGYQSQYPTGESPRFYQSYQTQYPVGFQKRYTQYPEQQNPKTTQDYQEPYKTGQSTQGFKHQYATPPPPPPQVNAISHMNSPPAPPLLNVHSNQGRVPTSYVPPPSDSYRSKSSKDLFKSPPPPQQTHVRNEPSYPRPPPLHPASHSETQESYGSPPLPASQSETPTSYDSHSLPASQSETPTSYGSNSLPASQSETPTSYDSHSLPASQSETPTSYGSNSLPASQSETPTSYDSHSLPASQSETPTSYDSPPQHLTPEHSSLDDQDNTDGTNQYDVPDNKDYGAPSHSNTGDKHGDHDNEFSKSMHGTESKIGSGQRDQNAFDKAASRFGRHHFGPNEEDYGKQNDVFHGFNSDADNGFGFRQYDAPKSQDFHQQGKAFDLINSKMAKQNALLNENHSVRNGASGTGGRSSDTESNTFSKPSKSASGKSGGNSIKVFDNNGRADGRARTLGPQGGINHYGPSRMFSNFGNFFRQPARKSEQAVISHACRGHSPDISWGGCLGQYVNSNRVNKRGRCSGLTSTPESSKNHSGYCQGVTANDKDNRVKFNFGNVDDFMNEEFRHHQGALQPIFRRNPFSNQGYSKLFPNQRVHLPSGKSAKRSSSNSIPHNSGNLNTEYGQFFDFV